MLMRNCAGGIVFYQDNVLLLQNHKREWVFPKGIIRKGMLSKEVALARVKNEAGVDARILRTVGETSYEFYSMTRQRPVCNYVTWYLMQADSKKCQIDTTQDFLGGGFYPVDEALTKITYSQDRSLASLSLKMYTQLVDEGKLTLNLRK